MGGVRLASCRSVSISARLRAPSIVCSRNKSCDFRLPLFQARQLVGIGSAGVRLSMLLELLETVEELEPDMSTLDFRSSRSFHTSKSRTYAHARPRSPQRTLGVERGDSRARTRCVRGLLVHLLRRAPQVSARFASHLPCALRRLRAEEDRIRAALEHEAQKAQREMEREKKKRQNEIERLKKEIADKKISESMPIEEEDGVALEATAFGRVAPLRT